MEALAATSFDRYARYTYTYRLRTELLPAERIWILDVGDPYGTLASLFPGDFTLSVDLFREGAPTTASHQHLLGSGFELPFPDGTFDLVTAHDVLEHLADGRRLEFIDELMRVSRGPVVVVAPFSDPRTATCERLVNSYYVAHTGSSLVPLDEHAEAGLPSLDRLRSDLAAKGVDALVYSDGWLFHWLAFMLLKAHYVSIGAEALDRATDAAFNVLLRDRDKTPPHYRRAVILRAPVGTTEVLGPPTDLSSGDVAADTCALEQLAWELASALPPGEDPSIAGSSLTAWIDRAIEGSGDDAKVADSLLRVLAAAVDRLGDPSTSSAVRGGVSAVVLAGTPAEMARARSVLERVDGVDEVVAAAPSSDHVLQLALTVEDLSGSAMLVVDPRIDFEPSDVEAMVASFGAGRKCVGYHYDQFGCAEAARSLKLDGDESLYVARGLMLVDRELYRAVGGLDGRLRGLLDDVDFGWRLNLLGHRVVSVGEAWWPAPRPPAVSMDAVVLQCWLKNLEQRTLERTIARHLLLMIDRPDAEHTREALFKDWASLARSREEMAERRVVDDTTITRRFGALCPTGAAASESFEAALVEALFPSEGTPRRPEAIVLASTRSADRMASIASGLAAAAEVSWAGPEPEQLESRVSKGPRPNLPELRRLAQAADLLVISGADVPEYWPFLTDWDGVLVVDLDGADDGVHPLALRRGDVFLFASDGQRNHAVAQLSVGQAVSSWILADGDAMQVVATAHSGVCDQPVRHRPRDPAVVLDLAGCVPSALALAYVGVFLDSKMRAELVVLPGPEFDESQADGLAQRSQKVLTAPLSAAGRAEVLSTASVVVRPTADEWDARLTSPAWSLDVLAVGVPLVTTVADPACEWVTSFRAGLVADADATQLVEATRRCLEDDAIRASSRLGAVEAGALLGQRARDTLAGIARRPERWQYAHRGGMKPLAVTPGLDELLRAQEVEVTRTVSAALHREMEQRILDELEEREIEYSRMRQRLEEAKRTADEAQSDLRRIRDHPLVRLLRVARRIARAVRG